MSENICSWWLCLNKSCSFLLDCYTYCTFWHRSPSYKWWDPSHKKWILPALSWQHVTSPTHTEQQHGKLPSSRWVACAQPVQQISLVQVCRAVRPKTIYVHPAHSGTSPLWSCLSSNASVLLPGKTVCSLHTEANMKTSTQPVQILGLQIQGSTQIESTWMVNSFQSHNHHSCSPMFETYQVCLYFTEETQNKHM